MAREHNFAAYESIVRGQPLKMITGKVLLLTMKAVLQQCEDLAVSKKFLLALGSKLDNPELEILAHQIAHSFRNQP